MEVFQFLQIHWAVIISSWMTEVWKFYFLAVGIFKVFFTAFIWYVIVPRLVTTRLLITIYCNIIKICTRTAKRPNYIICVFINHFAIIPGDFKNQFSLDEFLHCFLVRTFIISSTGVIYNSSSIYEFNLIYSCRNCSFVNRFGIAVIMNIGSDWSVALILFFHLFDYSSQ